MRDAQRSPPTALAALRARALDALRFGPREAVALAVLGLLVLGGATLAFVRARPTPAAEVAPAVVPSPSVAAPALVVVHVVGEVRRPGVYELPEGARVLDAVRAAGGLTRRADAAAINLARPVVDGEQIAVPRRGAPPPAAPAAPGAAGPVQPGAKINLNLAGAAELDTLPGIGPVLAGRIVAYRDEHGPFASVRDLLNVSGIGPKTFESIEPLVTV